MPSSQTKTPPFAPHLAHLSSPGSAVAGRLCPSETEARPSSSSAVVRANDPSYARRSTKTPELLAQGRGDSYVNSHDDPPPPYKGPGRRSTRFTRADVYEDSDGLRKDGTHVQSRRHYAATRRLTSEVEETPECRDEEWCRSVRAQRVLEALCGVWDRRMRGKNACGPEQWRTRRELLLAMRHIASCVAWYQDEERRGAWKRV